MKNTEFNRADYPPNRQANSNNENRFALHVCTSCRPSGFPREPKENRPGFCLYNQLDKLLEEQNLKDKIKGFIGKCQVNNVEYKISEGCEKSIFASCFALFLKDLFISSCAF